MLSTPRAPWHPSVWRGWGAAPRGRVSGWLAAAVIGACAPAWAAGPEAGATVVVYNSRDPASGALARFYAERREIPAGQVLGLDCSTAESVGRDEYDCTIARPLRDAFGRGGWWIADAAEGGEPSRVSALRVRILALIRGIPLRIEGVQAYLGDTVQPGPPGARNEAAVDSELATLAFGTRQISGPAANPYYRSFTPILAYRRAPVLLVCRLDGPTDEVVRRMITDSVATERVGLWGRAFLDARGIREGPYAEGDEWLREGAEHLWKRGVPVVFDDRPGTFPAGYPMIAAAQYYGWYTERVDGPFRDGTVRFARGAVAMHIHSFSAQSVRAADAHWVGPLLMRGAVATAGNVFEPYLGLSLQLDLFIDRLMAGMTFAESAYAASRVLSWMGTCVGDPLYRPYAVWNGLIEGEGDAARLALWTEYRRCAGVWMRDGKRKGREAFEGAGRRLRSGVLFEGLGMLQLRDGDLGGARRSFAEARGLYRSAREWERLTFAEATWLASRGRGEEALAVLRAEMKGGGGPGGALRAFELELDPPPPPPPPARPEGAAVPE